MLVVDPVAPDRPRHVQAGHVGQADVQDHGVEAVDGPRQLDAGPSVGGVLHDVAVLLEEAGKGAGEALVVLDQEQVHGCLVSPSRARR